MSRSQTRSNPFYVALVLAGITFAITAFAYCVMAFRAVAPARAGEASSSGASLMQWLDNYGIWLMLGELLLLAIFSFAAMATDDYWTKSNSHSSKEPQ